MNECLSNPCMNGGRCEDLLDHHVCNCETGYSGTLCQTGKSVICAHPLLSHTTTTRYSKQTEFTQKSIYALYHTVSCKSIRVNSNSSSSSSSSSRAIIVVATASSIWANCCQFSMDCILIQHDGQFVEEVEVERL